MAKVDQAEKRKLFFSLFYPVCFVAVLWIVELIELLFNLNFTSFGIYPRELYGLKGILFSAFIHSDFNHLINNSIPILVLGSALFYFYKSLAFRVVFISWISAGLYTWITARASFHIGASGLVYSLFGFLLISGFLRKNTSLVGISFLVAFLYGSMVWGILPWDQKISWEGHLWGLFIGVILAVYYRKKGPPEKKYSWDYEEENEETGQVDEQKSSGDNKHGGSNSDNTAYSEITYHYKEKDK